jgi:hypothetical protein
VGHRGTDLLVDQVGAVEKTVPLTGPGFVRVEDREGSRTLTPS